MEEEGASQKGRGEGEAEGEVAEGVEEEHRNPQEQGGKEPCEEKPLAEIPVKDDPSEDQNALPHRLLEADGLQGAPEEDLHRPGELGHGVGEKAPQGEEAVEEEVGEEVKAPLGPDQGPGLKKPGPEGEGLRRRRAQRGRGGKTQSPRGA